MKDGFEPCPDCSTPVTAEDNYCRQCGMYLAAVRPVTAVARAESRALVQSRPGLPAPVKKAATALAVGTALQVGLGLAGRYIAHQASRQAANAVASRPAHRPRKPAQAESQPTAVARQPVDDVAAVSETLVIRRVWIRRG